MLLIHSDFPDFQHTIGQSIYSFEVEALEPGSFYFGQFSFIVWNLGDTNYLFEQNVDFYCDLPSWQIYILKNSMVPFDPNTPADNFGEHHPTGLQTFFIGELSLIKTVPAEETILDSIREMTIASPSI